MSFSAILVIAVVLMQQGKSSVFINTLVNVLQGRCECFLREINQAKVLMFARSVG